MPLPFSFSSQRAPTGAVPPSGLGSSPLAHQEAAGAVDQGGGSPRQPTFGAQIFEAAVAAQKPAHLPDYQVSQAPLSAPLGLPPSHSPASPHTAHLHQPPPPSGFLTELDRHLRELTWQVEQLRNDFFSAATTISALRDRLERLEGRGGSGQAASAEVAVLRAELESWISQHFESAVEHCMHRIWARASTHAAPGVHYPAT